MSKENIDLAFFRGLLALTSLVVVLGASVLRRLPRPSSPIRPISKVAVL